MLQHEITSSHLRVETLKSLSALCGNIRSNKTCLYCLVRPPEHALPCGHSICDVCMMRFGIDAPGIQYRLEFMTCFLCKSTIDFTAQIKPPTAGARILSLDGGGTRGAISLEFLYLLQTAISIPLRELFDLMVGTSSGNFATPLLEARLIVDQVD